MELVIFTSNEKIKSNNNGYVFKDLEEMDKISFNGIHYASSDIHCLYRHENIWICFIHNDKAVAVLSFKVDGMKDIYHGCPYWVNYISVHPDFKCMGYGTRLVQELFALCHNAGIHWFLQSEYTKEGYNFIKDVFQRVSADYPHINFTDSDSWPGDMLDEDEEEEDLID